MPLPAFLGALVLLLLLLLAAAFLLVLRYSSDGRAGRALARGDRQAALAAADVGAERGELLAATLAARQLGRFPRALELAERLLRDDPEDGEALLERGLALAYAGDLAGARRDLTAARRLRADLAESIELHLAWVALRGGDRRQARRRFEEIEIPLETKLRAELGPGDPVFCEWFLQASDLWRAFEAPEKAAWACREAAAASRGSALGEIFASCAPDHRPPTAPRVG